MDASTLFLRKRSPRCSILVTPHSRCRLKLLRLDRIKDYLLMEEEFIMNQELKKPREEKQQVHLEIVELLCYFR